MLVNEVAIAVLARPQDVRDAAAFTFEVARNLVRDLVGKARSRAVEVGLDELDEGAVAATSSAKLRTEEQVDELDAVLRDPDADLVLRRHVFGDALTAAERMREVRARHRLRGEVYGDGG